MKAHLLIGLAMLACSAQAQQPAEAPGLLPAAVARPLLDQDPSVAAARAALEAARREADILEQSPYEWNAKLSGQRRTLDTGPRYQEWNAAIERPIRLPGKASADRNIGKATIEEAEARYGEALHKAARDLATLWLDWMGAEKGRELAQASLQSAKENLAAVDKRVRAGDASKLDASLAQADWAEQKRLENDARTQATIATTRLRARYPGVMQPSVALPAPVPLKQDLAFWRSRILAESDELKIAQALFQKARAHSERARAEKTPDPTIGIYTASEVGGRERISGVTISIPLPGGQRSRRAEKSIHVVETARLEVEQTKRQLEAEIAGNVATVNGAYDSLRIAEDGAAAMQDNAKLMQRAYALGEAELQGLLLARRQATAAAQSALAARIAAAKAYYLLLIDAHLVWELAHD